MRYAQLVFLVFVLLPQSKLAFAQHEQPSPRRTPKLFVQTNVDKVWKVAATEQKPLLVMFTSQQCMFCQKMLAETYGHPGIERLLQGRTKTVLAHSKDYRELTKKLGIRGYPTTLLISPKGKVLDVMEGFVPPKDFAQRVGPILAAQARQNVAQSAALAKPTAER